METIEIGKFADYQANCYEGVHRAVHPLRVISLINSALDSGPCPAGAGVGVFWRRCQGSLAQVLGLFGAGVEKEVRPAPVESL